VVEIPEVFVSPSGFLNIEQKLNRVVVRDKAGVANATRTAT
jgi:hypothetical protein